MRTTITNRRDARIEATVRKRNQLTLPRQAVEALGIREGDTVVIDVADGVATMRPIKHSYAASLAGIYGDAGEYVERERRDWP